MRGVAGWQYHLDDQQSAVGFHRFATVAENGKALVLITIVDDVRQKVHVTPHRNALKEIDGLDGDTIRKTARPDQRRCLSNHVRQIRENATRPRMAIENRGQKIAGSAADVN